MPNRSSRKVTEKNDGRIPGGGEQWLETIAALAVRLRETVRRRSEEWEARKHPGREHDTNWKIEIIVHSQLFAPEGGPAVFA
jgi:hypothetical protein